MGRASWIDQANGGPNDEPPRSGRGATTAAWLAFAEGRGYPVPKGAGRDAIVALVDAGPPPQTHAAPARSGRIEGPVFAAAVASVRSAKESGQLTDADSGAVAVLLDLARKIDGMVEGGRSLDNVTVPVYLKFSESLGLTPAARARLPKTGDGGGSKLAGLRNSPQLTAIRGGRAS